MRSDAGVVIAGAGQAGLAVATGLREMGYDKRIVLVGEEAYRPYQRPPLSKAYLLGTSDAERIALRPEHYYGEKRIEVLTGRKVVALDRAHHHAALDDDRVIGYEKFVFAVGARNRPLPVHGADLRGVFYLRTLDDAGALKSALATAKSAVVIGAGFIGLEFAAAAVKLGLAVTVLEVADRPMARALSPAVAAIFTREHAKSGVRFMFNSQVLHILGEDGAVVAVETVELERIAADVVLIGIGVQPNVEVAAAAGLDVRNGIVVSDSLFTADPDVGAVGDCAAHPNCFAPGALLRLESVQNAMDQGRCLASNLAGKATRYTNLPWFWSDQGSLKLQIAGITTGFEQLVVRGDTAGTACSAFCFKGGRLIGVESLNRPGEHMLARRLVGQHVTLTPAQVADPTFDLKAHLGRESAPPAP